MKPLRQALSRYVGPVDLAFMHGAKNLRAKLPGPRSHPKVMFVVGCQRSGTSIMNRVLGRAWNTYVFRESSALTTDDPEKLRLNGIDEVHRKIARVPNDLATAKVLVESQRFPWLLDEFPEAKALWMFRDVRGAASSSVSNFGENVGYDDLTPIAAGDPTDWRSEGASPEVREVVSRLLPQSLTPHEAAALFWWARNQIILTTPVEDTSRVAMLEYRAFVTDPKGSMQTLYRWMDVKYPGDRVIKDVHASSFAKGKTLELRPEIEALCAETWEQLLAKAETFDCVFPKPQAAVAGQ